MSPRRNKKATHSNNSNNSTNSSSSNSNGRINNNSTSFNLSINDGTTHTINHIIALGGESDEDSKEHNHNEPQRTPPTNSFPSSDTAISLSTARRNATMPTHNTTGSSSNDDHYDYTTSNNSLGSNNTIPYCNQDRPITRQGRPGGRGGVQYNSLQMQDKCSRNSVVSGTFNDDEDDHDHDKIAQHDHRSYNKNCDVGDSLGHIDEMDSPPAYSEDRKNTNYEKTQNDKNKPNTNTTYLRKRRRSATILSEENKSETSALSDRKNKNNKNNNNNQQQQQQQQQQRHRGNDSRRKSNSDLPVKISKSSIVPSHTNNPGAVPSSGLRTKNARQRSSTNNMQPLDLALSRQDSIKYERSNVNINDRSTSSSKKQKRNSSSSNSANNGPALMERIAKKQKRQNDGSCENDNRNSEQNGTSSISLSSKRNNSVSEQQHNEDDDNNDKDNDKDSAKAKDKDKHNDGKHDEVFTSKLKQSCTKTDSETIGRGCQPYASVVTTNLQAKHDSTIFGRLGCAQPAIKKKYEGSYLYTVPSIGENKNPHQQQRRTLSSKKEDGGDDGVINLCADDDDDDDDVSNSETTTSNTAAAAASKQIAFVEHGQTIVYDENINCANNENFINGADTNPSNRTDSPIPTGSSDNDHTTGSSSSSFTFDANLSQIRYQNSKAESKDADENNDVSLSNSISKKKHSNRNNSSSASGHSSSSMEDFQPVLVIVSSNKKTNCSVQKSKLKDDDDIDYGDNHQDMKKKKNRFSPTTNNSEWKMRCRIDRDDVDKNDEKCNISPATLSQQSTSTSTVQEQSPTTLLQISDVVDINSTVTTTVLTCQKNADKGSNPENDLRFSPSKSATQDPSTPKNQNEVTRSEDLFTTDTFKKEPGSRVSNSSIFGNNDRRKQNNEQYKDMEESHDPDGSSNILAVLACISNPDENHNNSFRNKTNPKRTIQSDDCSIHIDLLDETPVTATLHKKQNMNGVDNKNGLSDKCPVASSGLLTSLINSAESVISGINTAISFNVSKQDNPDSSKQKKSEPSIKRPRSTFGGSKKEAVPIVPGQTFADTAKAPNSSKIDQFNIRRTLDMTPYISSALQNCKERREPDNPGRPKKIQCSESLKSTGCSTRITRSNTRESQKENMKKRVEIEIIDSDSDATTPSTVCDNTSFKRMGAVRIAFGKKVFHNDCYVTFDKHLSILELCYRQARTGKYVDYPIFLEEDLLEVKYFPEPSQHGNEDENNRQLEEVGGIGGDDEDRESDDKIECFLSIRCHMTKTNKLDRFRESYSPLETEEDDEKKFLIVEFRSLSVFELLISQLQKMGEYGQYFNKDASLRKYDIDHYCKALIRDSEKEEKKRRNSMKFSLRSFEKSKYKFLAEKKNDDLLLVYPFAGIKDKIEAASKDLKEAGKDPDSLGFDQGIQFDDAEKNGSQLEQTCDARTHYLEIHVNDFARLEPGEFLNDTLIDFWFQWVWRNEDKKDIHIFSSHFYTTLLKKGPPGVKTWTEKKGIDVFTKKFIFIPINKSLHWSLCVVVNPGAIGTMINAVAKKYEVTKLGTSKCPMLLFFDSLKAHQKEKVALHVRKWLNSEWIRLGKDSSPSLQRDPFQDKYMHIVAPKVPYQSNSWDCGVFVCRYGYAMFLLRSKEFNFEERGVINNKVKGSLERLINSGKAFQFDSSDIERMREELKVLIERLSSVYFEWKDMRDRKEKEKKLKSKQSIIECPASTAPNESNPDAEPNKTWSSEEKQLSENQNINAEKSSENIHGIADAFVRINADEVDVSKVIIDAETSSGNICVKDANLAGGSRADAANDRAKNDSDVDDAVVNAAELLPISETCKLSRVERDIEVTDTIVRKMSKLSTSLKEDDNEVVFQENNCFEMKTSTKASLAFSKVNSNRIAKSPVSQSMSDTRGIDDVPGEKIPDATEQSETKPRNTMVELTCPQAWMSNPIMERDAV